MGMNVVEGVWVAREEKEYEVLKESIKIGNKGLHYVDGCYEGWPTTRV